MGNQFYSNCLGGIGGQGAMTAIGLQALYNQQANSSYDMLAPQAWSYQYQFGNSRRRNVIAAGFEVLYKFKLFEKTQSKTVIAETAERAKEVFFKTFEDAEKQPRIVSVEETVVEL